MKSKSFRKGFVDGLTASASLFVPAKLHRSDTYNGSVERAWRSVGVELARATEAQGAKLGQRFPTKGRT